MRTEGFEEGYKKGFEDGDYYYKQLMKSIEELIIYIDDNYININYDLPEACDWRVKEIRKRLGKLS